MCGSKRVEDGARDEDAEMREVRKEMTSSSRLGVSTYIKINLAYNVTVAVPVAGVDRMPCRTCMHMCSYVSLFSTRILGPRSDGSKAKLLGHK